MKSLQLLISLGTVPLLLNGAVVTGNAATRVNYVSIRQHTGKLVVYAQLPHSVRAAKRALRKDVSSTQVFKVLQRKSGVHGIYLKLKQLGWVRQAATKKLSHVSKNGTLIIYKQQKMSNKILVPTSQRSITIETNGPIGTHFRTNYHDLTARQFRSEHVRVTGTGWTDFGRYYHFQGEHLSGWVNAATIKLVTNKVTKVSARKNSKRTIVHVKTKPQSRVTGIKPVVKGKSRKAIIKSTPVVRKNSIVAKNMPPIANTPTKSVITNKSIAVVPKKIDPIKTQTEKTSKSTAVAPAKLVATSVKPMTVRPVTPVPAKSVAVKGKSVTTNTDKVPAPATASVTKVKPVTTVKAAATVPTKSEVSKGKSVATTTMKVVVPVKPVITKVKSVTTVKPVATAPIKSDTIKVKPVGTNTVKVPVSGKTITTKVKPVATIKPAATVPTKSADVKGKSVTTSTAKVPVTKAKPVTGMPVKTEPVASQKSTIKPVVSKPVTTIPQGTAKNKGATVTTQPAIVKPTSSSVAIGKKVLNPAKPNEQSTQPGSTVIQSGTQPKNTIVAKGSVTQAVKPTAVSPLSAATMTKIDNIITQNHFMGTLLVTNDGPSSVKVQSFGDANVAKNIANTNDEAYPLASLQKAVTGAVVQQLINSGKLSMTTTLSKFYPTVPYANQITIRELLDHTSGIRMGEPVPSSILPDEASAVAFTISHLTSTNDHVWSYSNANFTLLAGIISQVTGKSYWDNVETDIIEPLKLKNMYLYNQVPATAVTPASYTYKKSGSKADSISDALLSSELGCGNLYASVGDFYTVINSLLSGKLDGKAGLSQLTDNYALKYSGGIYYQAGGLVRIGGADNSFHTIYVGSNDGRVGVVLFTNQSGWAAVNTAGSQILKLVDQNS